MYKDTDKIPTPLQDGWEKRWAKTLSLQMRREIKHRQLTHQDRGDSYLFCRNLLQFRIITSANFLERVIRVYNDRPPTLKQAIKLFLVWKESERFAALYEEHLQKRNKAPVLA
jgi:hypothetical protein